jgi:hypothetical protein
MKKRNGAEVAMGEAFCRGRPMASFAPLQAELT